MATNKPNAVVTSASAIPAETAPSPPEPVIAIPWNAWMMPATVPKRPTKGAVVEIVARLPRPFFISAVVISVSRSMARLPDSTMSKSSGSCCVISYWNSVSPALSTRARCECMKRLSRVRLIADSRSCFASSGVTSRARSSDSFFARWKRNSRSTAIVRDQTDMMNKTTTTPRATQFIVAHMPRRLKFVFIPSIGYSFYLSSTSLQPERHGQVVIHRNRLPVECSRCELPAFHGFERRIGETERQRLEDTRVGDVAVAVDDRFQHHDPFDARLPRHFR